MARCTCSKPCNCAIAQNGAPIIVENSQILLGQAALFPTSRVGWRDNLVAGTGSSGNPYTVSFKDSLEFRPAAQEWRYTGSDYDEEGFATDPNQYSTPVPNAMFVWSAAFETEINVAGTGFLIGAYADVNTGGVATPVELHLFYDFQVVNTGPDRIAGSTTQAANPVLTCVGYVNPLRSAIPLASSGLFLSILLDVRAPALTSDSYSVPSVRVWAVEV